jgi:SHAQKYF class myb-like DNA-binding protein
MGADATQNADEPPTISPTALEKPMPAFSGGLFGAPIVTAPPPPPLRVTDPKTPAPAEKEDAPCASVTSGSSEGSATPDGASDEENVRAPKLPALPAAADEAPADDATPEQAAADDEDADDAKAPEKAEENVNVPAAAEDDEDAADEDAAADAAPENDDAAEDADDATPEKAAEEASHDDDATPEKAASDDDASPKPTQKIPKPRGRAPQGKAWDPDQGRWGPIKSREEDESDDEETLDVMRQRASRSASVEEDIVRPARTESLEDVESRFLATPEKEDEPTPEKTSPEQEKNENTGRWTDDEHARFLRGLELFGKKWSKVADVVQSRTTIQVRSHAQKYLKKFEEESDDDEETLEARSRRPVVWRRLHAIFMNRLRERRSWVV